MNPSATLSLLMRIRAHLWFTSPACLRRMNRPPSVLPACLLSLFMIPTAQAREVLLRFTSFGVEQPLNGVVLAAGDERTDSFNIPDNGFSLPIAPPTADCGFVLGIADGDGVRRLADVRLPEDGRRFLVLMLPAGNGSVRPMVIRADDPGFRAGHVMILNLAPQPLAADLGGQRLEFAPGSRTVFRPRREGNLANYQVRFYHMQDGAPSVFAATLWPYFEGKRAYVFLHMDPRRGAPTFRAIDEFTDWLGE